MGIGEFVDLFGPGLVASVAIALQCALLSVFVTLRRLAFLGQGVSHSALGGYGVAAILSLGTGATFGVVAGFCVAAALGMAWLSGRKGAHEDTVIGVFLVGSMALGVMLLSIRHRMGGAGNVPGWESLLFGSIVEVDRLAAMIAWGTLALIAGVLWWVRRPMAFCVFDESAAAAFGVRVGVMRAVLMVLLAIAIVVAMRLAGVVLATAFVVLPGATALRVTGRLWRAHAVSCVVAVMGMLGGVWASVGLDLPVGACIVGALVALFALSWPTGMVVEKVRLHRVRA